MRRMTGLATTLLLVLLHGGAALASGTFYIDATILRPAIKASPIGALRANHPVNSNSVEWVPASHQYVYVYQDHWAGPQLCQVATTNSQGKFPSGTAFSCGANKPNQVQLVVLGDSSRGFRVGSNSPFPHEQLHVSYAWKWYSHWKIFPTSGSTISFTLRIGDVGYPSWVSAADAQAARFENLNFRAAALVELLDLLYRELNLGTAHLDGERRYVPIFSNWIVNDALSGILSLSAPWTYWNTVHVPAGASTTYALESAPHELGHVLYNMQHSGWDHYSVEVFDYVKNHSTCDVYDSHFAAYEGFAHAVRSLAWAHHADDLGSTAYGAPYRTCSQKGILREGNVDEFYSHAFAGIPLERPPVALDQWATHQVGANVYAFAPTLQLLDMVQEAGMNAEDLSQMWSQSLSGICAGDHNGVPKFCGSRRFKCLAKNGMIQSADVFPAEFKNANCDPGGSGIIGTSVGATAPESAVVTVAFSPAGLVDQYRVLVPSVGSFPVNLGGQDPGQALSTAITVPTCRALSFQIETRNDYGTTVGPAVTMDPVGSCGGQPQRTFRKMPVELQRMESTLGTTADGDRLEHILPRPSASDEAQQGESNPDKKPPTPD